MRLRRLLVFLVAPLAGCTVGAGELSPSDTAVNHCDSESDCAVGVCDHNICKGKGGTLTSLLIAVTPPTSQAGITSLTSFRSYPVDGAGMLGSGGARLDLKVDPALDFDGTASVDTTDGDPAPTFWGSLGPNQADTYQFPDGSDHIPVNVVLTPSQHTLGLSVDTFAAPPTAAGYNFKLTLPPGDYDVYITPHFPSITSPLDGTFVEVPPQLYLNQSLTSGVVNFKLAPPLQLPLEIAWPVGPGVLPAEALDPLADWTVDLVDPNSGKVLSTKVTLGSPVLSTDMTSVTYETTLWHSPIYATDKGVLVPQGVGSELLRLRPPDFYRDGLTPYTAPIIYAQLDGALVDPDGKASTARIVQDQPLPSPVSFEFTTALPADPTPVPAAVTLTAVELDGVVGLSTKFTRTVDVAEDGIGGAELLPGRYRVNAVAKSGCATDSCLSATELEWLVSADVSPQRGQVIEFAPAPQLTGQVVVARGDAAVGATVRAVASTTTFESNLLNLGDGSAPVLPRASVAVVDPDGQYSFEADPGTFDFAVEPDPSTGFGWFVYPRVSLPADIGLIDSVVVDLPIVYRGNVLLNSQGSGVPIPGAQIRAYVYLKADGTLTSKPGDGVVVMQVAEAQADDAGGFALLVPPRLGGR